MMGGISVDSKVKKLILMLAVGVVTYHIILFAICGFQDHGFSFWSSYVFMMLAFVVLVAEGYFLREGNTKIRDWMLGYPILKHCAIYLIAETAVSTFFICFDKKEWPWFIAFVLQTILIAIHLFFAISCFLAKEMVEKVQRDVRVKTSKIKMLQIDLEMLAEDAKEPELKKELTRLAEQAHYSDPVSQEGLQELESQILVVLTQIKESMAMGQKEETLRFVHKFSLLLTERNKKCKALK